MFAYPKFFCSFVSLVGPLIEFSGACRAAICPGLLDFIEPLIYTPRFNSISGRVGANRVRNPRGEGAGNFASLITSNKTLCRTRAGTWNGNLIFTRRHLGKSIWKKEEEADAAEKSGPHNANNNNKSINHLHNFVTIFAMQFLLERGFFCPVWFFVSLIHSLSLSFCLIQSNKWGVPLGRRSRPFYLHLLTARWDCCWNCLWIRPDGTVHIISSAGGL